MIADRSCDWETYDSKASERGRYLKGIVPVEHRRAMVDMEFQNIDLLEKMGKTWSGEKNERRPGKERVNWEG